MVLFTPLADPIWTPPGPSVPLTLSGNEITPYVRRFGREGDGLNPNEPLGKYSIGVWEATTNLVTNGGFETNTTGWTDGGNTTLSRSTEQAKFGSASGKSVCDATNAGENGMAAFSVTLTAAIHTYSFWVYIPSSWTGGTVSIDTSVFTSATPAAGTNTDANMALRDQWQRISAQITPDAGSLTGQVRVVATGIVSGEFIYVDGAQVEAQPLATPYVHTDGGTASRSAARPQLANIARYITPGQGWFAALLQMGFAANADIYAGAFPALLTWRDDSTHELSVQYDVGNDKWGIVRRAAGATRGNETNAQTFVVGDLCFVLCTWTPAALATATNGGAFNSSADTNVPAIAATAADLASFGASNYIDSTPLFFAMGRNPSAATGFSQTLNNIARNNRIDSRPEDLPGGCTFKWSPADGDVTRALVAA